MRTILQDVDRVLASKTYRAWAALHQVDDKKIRLERTGKRRPLSDDSWTRCFIEAIRVGLTTAKPTPPPEPLPPVEPIYVKVAPRVAYKAGGSDARFCIYNQPGVVQSGNEWRDESGATYDENGLCKNGRRSDGPAVTSALEIDGRNYCDLPTMGDPKTNTGSWAI